MPLSPKDKASADDVKAKKPVEGVDYYFDGSGLMVLTAKYLLARGYCCGNGCRHCPYDGRPTVKQSQEQS